jgi:putative ABC transport system substrate-binding protein
VNLQLEKLKAEANEMGVEIVEAAAKSPDDIQADLDRRKQLKDIGIDVMLVIVEPISLTPGVFTMFGKFADEYKIPVCGVLMSEGEYGTVFGLLPNNIKIGGQAALLADKVLKGSPAGKIPVQSPEMYLKINYKAAQKLGITIPESIANQAVEIIK